LSQQGLRLRKISSNGDAQEHQHALKSLNWKITRLLRFQQYSP
jgi:hypothetical protein